MRSTCGHDIGHHECVFSAAKAARKARRNAALKGRSSTYQEGQRITTATYQDWVRIRAGKYQDMLETRPIPFMISPAPRLDYFVATAVTTSNKILGARRTSSTRTRSSLPCSVLPSAEVAVYGENP
jgi:hypothetical protein